MAKPNPIYDKLLPEWKRLIETTSYAKASEILVERHSLPMKASTFQTKMTQRLKTESETQDYKEQVSLSDDRFLSYCKSKGIDASRVRSAKWVNHAGQEEFNIVLDYDKEDTDIDWSAIKNSLAEDLKKLEVVLHTQEPQKGEGVVTISDLHLGAYIDGLIRTPDFNITTLTKKLESSLKIINSHKYSKVHIHILGDLIESFSGLNHKNSWKGLAKGMHGSNAVKLVTEILSEWLSKIYNLGEVKIIAGNHDRTSSNNDEDVNGQAADLVAWGLKLMGYSVEFNSLVLTHTVEGICYILTHGHHGLSKMGTKEICWEYGEQGKFNLISEGHLHSRFKRTAVKKNHLQIMDDAVDHRRIIHPSIFTGNFYSESNGWTTNAGFTIIEDNGSGKPNAFDYSL